MKSYTTYKIMNNRLDKISMYLDINKTYLLMPNANMNTVMNGSFEKVFNKLDQIKGIKYVGSYHYVEESNSIFNKDMLSINYGMLNFLNLKINYGRNFNKDDFKYSYSGKIPIIIGDNLSNIYALGENIYINNSKTDNSNFQVIGILKEDQKFFKNDILNAGLVDLSNVILIPSNFDFAASLNTYGRNLLYIPNGSEVIISEIDSLFKEYKIPFSISLIKNSVENQYKDDLNILNGYLIINFSMIIFSLFGIVVTMIMLVESRKREFGIRLATGATKSYLYSLILGEMLVTDVIGFIFGLLIYRLEGGSTIEYSLSQSFFEFYNFKVIGAMIGISLALIILFSLNVIVRIYKMEPRELIKGRD